MIPCSCCCGVGEKGHNGENRSEVYLSKKKASSQQYHRVGTKTKPWGSVAVVIGCSQFRDLCVSLPCYLLGTSIVVIH